MYLEIVTRFFLLERYIYITRSNFFLNIFWSRWWFFLSIMYVSIYLSCYLSLYSYVSNHIYSLIMYLVFKMSIFLVFKDAANRLFSFKKGFFCFENISLSYGKIFFWHFFIWIVLGLATFGRVLHCNLNFLKKTVFSPLPSFFYFEY